MGDLVLDQVTAAGLIVMLVQWVKNTKLVPWINNHTALATRILSWAAAFATATGVHYMYDKEQGTLLFTGLTLSAVFSSTWHWISSIVAQELIYRGVVPSQQRVVDTVKEAAKE